MDILKWYLSGLICLQHAIFTSRSLIRQCLISTGERFFKFLLNFCDLLNNNWILYFNIIK